MILSSAHPSSFGIIGCGSILLVVKVAQAPHLACGLDVCIPLLAVLVPAHTLVAGGLGRVRGDTAACASAARQRGASGRRGYGRLR